jgi:hypothetical protein
MRVADAIAEKAKLVVPESRQAAGGTQLFTRELCITHCCY